MISNIYIYTYLYIYIERYWLYIKIYSRLLIKSLLKEIYFRFLPKDSYRFVIGYSIPQNMSCIREWTIAVSVKLKFSQWNIKNQFVIGLWYMKYRFAIVETVTNKIWWLCLVPTSTTRFALGVQNGQKLIGLYKENTLFEQWCQIP